MLIDITYRERNGKTTEGQLAWNHLPRDGDRIFVKLKPKQKPRLYRVLAVTHDVALQLSPSGFHVLAERCCS